MSFSIFFSFFQGKKKPKPKGSTCIIHVIAATDHANKVSEDTTIYSSVPDSNYDVHAVHAIGSDYVDKGKNVDPFNTVDLRGTRKLSFLYVRYMY